MPTIKVNIPQVGAVNFPDGMSADEIHSAVGQIYSQALAANPPQAAGPQIAMQHSALGDLAPQSVPRSNSPNTQAGFPGYEGSYSSGDEGKAAVMTGAGITAGVALGATAATPVVVNALRTAAQTHPFVAEVIKAGLKGLGWGAGIKIGAKFMKLSDLLNTGQ